NIYRARIKPGLKPGFSIHALMCVPGRKPFPSGRIQYHKHGDPLFSQEALWQNVQETKHGSMNWAKIPDRSVPTAPDNPATHRDFPAWQMPPRKASKNWSKPINPLKRRPSKEAKTPPTIRSVQSTLT